MPSVLKTNNIKIILPSVEKCKFGLLESQTVLTSAKFIFTSLPNNKGNKPSLVRPSVFYRFTLPPHYILHTNTTLPLRS